MAERNNQHWFKRRRYGYGWTPVTWQGWVWVSVLLVVVIGGAIVLATNPYSNTLLWLYLTAVVTAVIALLIITTAKGPRPRWRWGKKANDGDDDF